MEFVTDHPSPPSKNPGYTTKANIFFILHHDYVSPHTCPVVRIFLAIMNFTIFHSALASFPPTKPSVDFYFVL